MTDTQYRAISHPEAGEYAPYTADYVNRVPDDEKVLSQLAQQTDTLHNLLDSLTVPLDVPHAEGEWTVKEILVHVIDTERVFAYRALRVARGDTTEIPGFSQDDYVVESGANARTIDDIFAEYVAVRQATLTLFNSFSDPMLLRQGVASGYPVSVRAVAYQIAGHELHHMDSISANYRR